MARTNGNPDSLLEDETQKPKWGHAGILRGIDDHPIACQFAKDFQDDRQFSSRPFFFTEQFDRWADKRGFIRFPEAVSIESDEWIAHRFRRGALLRKLRSAASHPRMENPFTIVRLNPGRFEVRPVQRAIIHNNVLVKIKRYFETVREELSWWFQANDGQQISPEEQFEIEMIYDQIEMANKVYLVQVESYYKQLAKIRAKYLRNGSRKDRPLEDSR
jgi:hypothetical protein